MRKLRLREEEQFAQCSTVRKSQGSSSELQALTPVLSASIPASLAFIFLPPAYYPTVFILSAGHRPWARDWGSRASQSWVLGTWRLCHVRGSCCSPPLFYRTPNSRSHFVSLGYLASSRVVDMDLFQFLVFLFILLLSGAGVSGSLRTSLDPGLEICILWRWSS